jgi:hypothetical protein
MRIDVPKIDGVTIQLEPPAGIKLAGTLTKPDPAATLGVFFQHVHQDAVARRLSEVTVDVTELTFVNSSSIRLFIDWGARLKAQASPYVLRFRTSRQITWQVTAFSALVALMKDVVTVDRA